ncbi:hypothetical protein ACE01N_15475 [Saccharicrinis sp. FJH2]|uniref:hypothetical protein n=1 Tax=Saccharicrinis sp. FJH65 TaxID=3344659 RepID=UPI0035F4B365
MKRLFIILLLIISIQFIKAQEVTKNDSLINAALDELLFEDDIDLYELFDGNTNFHFLYFGSMYNSRSFYAGREIIDPLTEGSIHNTSAQLYYFISNGLYFGTSGAWYSQMDPSFRTAVFTLGYTKGLKKHDFFRYRASYNRFIYLNMGTDYNPNFYNNLNLGFSLKHKNTGLRFDYAMMTGSDTISHQFSIDLYTRIKLLSLGRLDRIQFKPEISTYFGSELVETLLNPEQQNQMFFEPVYGYNEKFGLLNTQLILPVSISYKDFDFEIAYIHNFPRTLDPLYYYDSVGYMQFSIGYILKIK